MSKIGIFPPVERLFLKSGPPSIAKINVPDVIWYIDFGLLKNYEPSSPSILGIQTIPDIDLGDPNPHGH